MVNSVERSSSDNRKNIKNMKNIMIYNKEPKKQEIKEDIHITINVFLFD